MSVELPLTCAHCDGSRARCHAVRWLDSLATRMRPGHCPYPDEAAMIERVTAALERDRCVRDGYLEQVRAHNTANGYVPIKPKPERVRTYTPREGAPR